METEDSKSSHSEFMESIRVQNLRCLADSSSIELKPITLLVGANSSGKSSFLRVFPLLKQSVETRTLSGLLLNEGEVNLGFFDEAIYKDAASSELKLEFGVVLRPGIYQGGFTNRFLIDATQASCELTYARRSKDEHYPYLRSVVVKLGVGPRADTIEICAEEGGKISKFSVNEYQANGEVSRLLMRVGRGVVPTLVKVLQEDESSAEVNLDSFEASAFDAKLLSETRRLFHGLTNDETKLAAMRSIRVGTPEQMLAAAKNITGVSSWTQRIQYWNTTTTSFVILRNLLLARRTGEILASLNNHISQFARSVHYFQPVRASVERDYSRRDVEVGAVDATGINVAIVLSSLGSTGLRAFRAWTLKHFNFEVFPRSVSDGARIALRMKEGNSTVDHNLADMGFGFSQMLPFLVQIWKLVEGDDLRRSPRMRLALRKDLAFPRNFLVAIEQPELHLHPALQARLADMFVTVARLSRENGSPIRFVLETHSSAIVDRIGALIEGNHLGHESVQVMLFERGLDGASSTATISPANYDKDGILEHWPFGFLSPPPDPAPLHISPPEIVHISIPSDPSSS